MNATPEPPGLPVLGHLWPWTASPLRLLEDGARTGPVFRLRLWRPAIVGYRPDFVRLIEQCGDLEVRTVIRPTSAARPDDQISSHDMRSPPGV